MNEKIFEALTAFANKLGTTAEHLWAVMVRQAHVSGWVAIVWGVICSVSFIVLCAWYFSRVGAWSKRFEVNGDTELKAPMWGSFIVASLILFAAAADRITCGIVALANPEFWALNKIISSL